MGISYLSDFVTGRSINPDDRAAAIVIVPAVGGYPDATSAAAIPPIHPHDRFTPVSLPIRGRVGDYGGFVPDPGQLSVDLLLQMAGMASWEKFETTAMDFHKGFTLSRPSPVFGKGREAIAGLAAMHEGTFAHLASSGEYGETREDAVKRAVAIVTDAAERYRQGDQSCFFVAMLRPPPGRRYETLSGDAFDVPALSRALSTGDRFELAQEAVQAIESRFACIGDRNASAEELSALFGELHDFRCMTYGLSFLNRYFAPSANAGQHDNLHEAVGLHLAAIEDAVRGLAGRRQVGCESREEFSDDIASIRRKLAELGAALDAEEALNAGGLFFR